jgi:periplasmic divalent cation tolerance protein
MDQVTVVLTNLPDAQSARDMAHRLVEARLAACVNCLPGVQSVYRWQGAVEEAGEVTLLIKSTAARYPELEAAIKATHPYELPEILALPATGLPAYLEWVAQGTRKGLDV